MPGRYRNQEKTEGFRNRLATVFNKANILPLYGADVYIVVRRRGKYHEYSSSDEAQWPPTKAQIAQAYPLPDRKSPADLDGRLRKSVQNIKGVVRGGIRTEGPNSNRQHLAQIDSQIEEDGEIKCNRSSVV